MSPQQTKIYLMLGGTFLPAFTGLAVYQLVSKNQKLDLKAIIVFGSLAAVGGYFTAKILNKKTV